MAVKKIKPRRKRNLADLKMKSSYSVGGLVTDNTGRVR